ncbi:MAG: hypothetical protein Homavirus1_24 [Homavirus sp.]|uniref:DoxX family protein n=1 Tax=Homavirus sp. TaxID=2487769 RepID=A0A3G5A678_9VIRU|nr:MAG: hypothetical protein Homavirus1_24 [Homavirus sp.]
MNPQIIGRVLVSSLFIATAIRGLFFNFGDFVGDVESKNIMFPTLVALIVLIFKLVAGLLILFNIYTNYAVSALICFIVLVTILYHNIYDDMSQFSNMMKNIAIVGGLFLLYK